MFSNVVWSTDGSEHADRALAYATDIARRDGAHMHVIHVIEKVVGMRSAGEYVHADEEEIEVKVRSQADALAADGLATTLHVKASSSNGVAATIAQTAQDAGADLIVVGTRGRSAVAGAMLGSVAQRMLHVSWCPVLVVPPAHEG